MQIKAYRTVSTRIQASAMGQALEALQLAAKNLKNMGLFLVKNVLSSFDSNGKLMPLAGLHANQVEALASANLAAAACNLTRKSKNDAKEKERETLQAGFTAGTIALADFEKAKGKLKDSKLFADFLGPDANPWAILDDALLDKAMRTRKDQNGQTPFAALPAKAAEQVRMQICSEFKSWRKAIQSYGKSPGKFKGVPRMPSYLAKNGKMPVKFFAGALGAKRFPSIEDRSLYMDFEKSTPLPPEGFAAYAGFDWGQLKAQLQTQVDRPDAKLMEARFVPGRLGTSAIEGVFECPTEIFDSSFLAATLRLAKSSDIKPSDLADFFAQRLAGLSAKDLPRAAGADLGLGNLISVAYSTGRKALIVSNARIEAKVKLFDAKIDGRIRSLALAAPPAIRALQKRRADGERLPKREHILAKQFDKQLHSDAELEALREGRERWLADILHKVSDDIVKGLVKERVELFVAGRNIGWKTESNLGKDGNRRFHATPHAQLLKMLGYKCADAGILFIEQEESYTSQASFALNEPIKTYGKEDQNTSPLLIPVSIPEIKEINPFKRTTPSLSPMSAPRSAKPRRIAPKGAKATARHQFQIPRKSKALLVGLGLDAAWLSLHADANGAYNILRKAVPSFLASRGLSTRFELAWASARGLRAFRKA